VRSARQWLPVEQFCAKKEASVLSLSDRKPATGEPIDQMTILVLDNYDSFTYNLVQRLGEIDPSVDIQVVRNDKISLDEIDQMKPERILISPGPCSPNEAGISIPIVERFAGKLPILGVCLGHQSIGQALGGNIVRAPELMHGKTDHIFHDNRGFFEGLPNPFVATRYHSLVIEPSSLPDDLEVSAWTQSSGSSPIIMGVRHRRWPLEGWQFHPESFLTEPGIELLRRFLYWQIQPHPPK
jgi:anthranilate synthase/aminodeoxychorismate synthase-like glutamine amidotransferase